MRRVSHLGEKVDVGLKPVRTHADAVDEKLQWTREHQSWNRSRGRGRATHPLFVRMRTVRPMPLRRKYDFPVLGHAGVGEEKQNASDDPGDEEKGRAREEEGHGASDRADRDGQKKKLLKDRGDVASGEGELCGGQLTGMMDGTEDVGEEGAVPYEEAEVVVE